MTPAKTYPPGLEGMFEEFQSFLYEAAGIYFPLQNKDRLLGHVLARMEATGKAGARDYLALLKRSAGPNSEQWAFFNQTTVNETYFFRDEVQFTVLKEKILPELFQARRLKRRPKVNILSAACSSGEEAYSLAILIRESFPMESSFVSLTGVDLNSQVIERARQAVYNEYSVRMCTPQQRSTFFTQKERTYEAKPDLKSMARFEVGNLTDPATLKKFPQPDLILCRNALIYFDKTSKSKVVTGFSSIMNPEGYLLLGRTESLFGVEHPFQLVHFFRTCAYRPPQ